jgi:hypothetical protein
MDSDFKVIQNNTTTTIQTSLHCLQAHQHGQTTRTSSSDNNNSLAKGNARQQATTFAQQWKQRRQLTEALLLPPQWVSSCRTLAMLAALRTNSLFISAHALMTSLLVLATITSLTFDCHMDLFGWPTNQHSVSALLLSIYQLSGSWHRSCMLPQSSNTPEMIAPSQSSAHPWTTCLVIGRIIFDMFLFL